jgi:hypothetical protein
MALDFFRVVTQWFLYGSIGRSPREPRKENIANSMSYSVPQEGFEPPTPSLRMTYVLHPLPSVDIY